MDNELLLGLIMDLVNEIDPQEVSTIQLNRSKAGNGYEGLTIDIVFSEPRPQQEDPKDKEPDSYA